jgi:hypothetical protein
MNTARISTSAVSARDREGGVAIASRRIKIL